MKKPFILVFGILALVALLIASEAKAAPTTTFFQSIAPTTNAIYDNGTASLAWLHGFFVNASTTNATISGKLYDGTASPGSNGQFLKTTGTGLAWTTIVSGVSSVFGRTGAVIAQSGDYTTTQVTEGTNLYWTNTRFDNRLSATTTLPNITTLASLSLPFSQTTGTVPVNRGGTNITSYTGNQILYTNAAGTAFLQTATSTLSIGGNAGTATALAANGTNCSVGNYPLGVDASGNSESCTAASTGTVTSVALTVPTFLSVSGSPVTGAGTLAVTLSGTALPVLNGGTGLTSFTGDQIFYSNHAGTAILQTATSTLSIGGNAATATALAANGTNCSAGSYPLGVDASGNSESCTVAATGTVTAITIASANGFAGSSSGGATPALTISTSITGVLKGNGTAMSAAANGTDFTLVTANTCSAGQFFNVITAAGVLSCGTPSGGGGGGSGSVGTSSAEFIGGVPFATTNAATPALVSFDNNFFWDNTNKRLGLGSTTPFGQLAINGISNSTQNLFVIASSSSTGTTTVLTVDSIGNITSAGSITLNDINQAVQGSSITTTNTFAGTAVGNGRTGGTFTETNNSTTASVRVKGIVVVGAFSGAVNNAVSNAALNPGGAAGAVFGSQNNSTGFNLLNQVAFSAVTQMNQSGGGDYASTTNAFDVVLQAPSGNGTHDLITNFYGLQYMGTSPSFTVNNATGINLNDATYGSRSNVAILIGTSTNPAGNYGIYQYTPNTNFFNGNIGIASSSPYGNLTVTDSQSNATLFPFVVASSTAAATTTLFSINNIGTITTSLGLGLVKSSATGVLSIGASGTDYAPATSGSALLLGNGSGGFSNYAGVTCTNQFLRALSTAGASTCATVQNTDLANSTISGVALGGTLAALTATDSTLTFSGSYTGTTARTVGINLATTNNWTGFLGIGTTTPAFPLSISTSIQQSGSLPLFAVASTTNATILTALGNGNVGVGTSTPGSLFGIQGVANFNTGTSTILTGLRIVGNVDVNGTATSTFAHGINIASGGGCFAINGTCVGGGGGGTITLSGDVSGSGTTAITTTIGALKVVNSMIAAATIDLTTKVTGLLPVANGGTAASTVAGAQANLLIEHTIPGTIATPGFSNTAAVQKVFSGGSIPANALGTTGQIRARIYFQAYGTASSGNFNVNVGYGTATTTFAMPEINSQGYGSGIMDIILTEGGTTASQNFAMNFFASVAGSVSTLVQYQFVGTGTQTDDDTVAQPFNISIACSAANPACNATVMAVTVELLPR